MIESKNEASRDLEKALQSTVYKGLHRVGI